MISKLMKKFTKGYKKVPLFWVTFNLEKYLKNGEKGSCDLKLHPNFKNDEIIISCLNSLVDHIRENYDMEKLSK